jgi:hypothetical protein
MEVHAHTHSERKKWTHYLWEFLMLFLAVFCGFLAENQREHMVEHQREKKFAQSLYEDLKVDTSLLNASIKERKFVITKIDTFMMLVHTKAIDELPAGTWSYFGRFGSRNLIVLLQDATLQQLLNSGGLRLFKKQNVADSIAQFDQAVRNMHEGLVYLNLGVGDLIKARNIIFDSWYLDDIMDLTVSTEIIDSFKKKSFPLLSNKKDDFIQYANLCHARSFNLSGVLARIETAAQKAERLLALLKEEYHLK